jgi:hypothetical protein
MSRYLSILRRVAIWSLFALAVVVTLWAAFCIEERVRGRKKWETYRSEAAARGVKLDLKDVLQPDVPDAENFAAIPMVRALFETKPPPTWFSTLKLDQTGVPSFGDSDKGKPLDLAKWRDFFVKEKVIAEAGSDPGADVLKALAAVEPELAQLREGMKRPRSKFPVRWEKGFEAELPHLGAFVTTAKVLRLRMTAQLAVGDSAGALETCREMLGLYRVLKDELVLISGLVRLAILGSAEASVRDGIAAGHWTDPELARLPTEFAAIDLESDWRFSMESERAGMNFTIDMLYGKSSAELAKLLGVLGATGFQHSPPVGDRISTALYPRGWLHLSQTMLNEYFDSAQATIDDLVAGKGSVPRSGGIDDIIKVKSSGVFRSLPYVLAIITAPAMEGVQSSYLKALTRVAQVRTACALERYKLARGSFPEKLDSIAPEFLSEAPHDPIDLAPLRYRRTESGYDLWSVALNRTDEGGQPEDKPWKQQADWVFRR